MSHRNELMEKPFLMLKRAYQPQERPFNAHICVNEQNERSLKLFPKSQCNICRMNFHSYDVHVPEAQLKDLKSRKNKRKSVKNSSLAKEENNGNVA